EHRPAQHHVRGCGHRGDPARDPPPVLPEATRARPHRRRGERMSIVRSRTRWTMATLAAVVASTGLSAVVAVPGAGAQNSTTCPLTALAKASKPVEITMWHWMARENETTLQRLVDTFNSSQRDVKVTLVNEVDWEATLQKYKSGLGTGDLPDV